MENKLMKILIIEDDLSDCRNFVNCVKKHDDIEIVSITDSDSEGIKLVKQKRPEGIILDLELNNSRMGDMDALDFVKTLRETKLGYDPIIIVTTHINSKATYDMLHRNGVDLILNKDQTKYSADYVLNKFISLRKNENTVTSIRDELQINEKEISDIIYDELELVGITPKLKGQKYLHDAILFLIQNENSNINVIQYITKTTGVANTTITNGMQNAIIHGWRVTAVEDLQTYYKAKVNYETGTPTPMEFVYYYVNKIKKMI